MSCVPSARNLCARTLEALQKRQESRPGLVPASEMRQVWVEAFGAEDMPYSVQQSRWRVILKPALEGGQVELCVRNRHAFYTLPPWRGMLPNARRVFSPRLVSRSHAAVRALRCAIEHHQTGVLGRDIGAHWEEANGRPASSKSTRWRRILAPALQDGVVIATRSGAHVIFRSADCPDLPDPPWPFDSDRVQEALRRANEALESAVPVELVEAEVAADPRLHLEGEILVSDVLDNLRRVGRVCITRTHGRGARSRRYYYVKGGPSRVHRSARRLLEARLDMIRGFWTANGGRPFTTRAVRRFARRSDPERFENEQYHSWTVALAHLATRGELVKLARARRRYALWAPAVAWRSLSEAQREERLRDPLRDPAGRPDTPTKSYLLARRHDPFFVSRNNDMRTLFQTARRGLEFGEGDREQAAIMAERPLRSRDVDRLIDPDHALRPARSLSQALWEATRVRNGMRNSELVRLGRIGHSEFYDLDPSAVATAYVRFRRALHDAEPYALFRDTRVLCETIRNQAWTLAPILPGILNVQGEAIVAEVGRLRLGLEESAAGVRLLSDEQADVQEVTEILTWLDDRLRSALAILGTPVHAADASDADEARPEAYPVEQAWTEVQPFLAARLRTPRAFPARIPPVSTIRAPRPPTGAPGRPIETDLDRVGWACYAAGRWAGPVFVHLARTAAASLGPIRTAGPFVRALGGAPPEYHMRIVAALAVLADERSREALVQYLWRAITAPRTVSFGAVELAAHGLSPLPFARRTSALSACERAALEALRDYGPDREARQAAERTLNVCGSDPDPEALRALYGMPVAPWHVSGGLDRTSADQPDARNDPEGGAR